MKSLELNWCRNEDKSLVIPEIEWNGCIEYGGNYTSPNEEYPFGLITINSSLDDIDIPATIAHEWRHHWQLFHGWTYDGYVWESGFEKNYEENIFDYFTTSECEMDALRFEYKHGKIPDMWEEMFYPYFL